MTMVSITLPDGSINEYASGISAGEIIEDIEGRKHGCIAAYIDDEQKDMSTLIDSDCTVIPIPADSDDGMHILRHSAAHLLAQAVSELYPGAKPTIGPAIDRGFYYDFADLEGFGESDLKSVQKKMHEIARRNLRVERQELSQGDLENHFAHNSYKIEIINEKLIDKVVEREGKLYCEK